jgi:glycosyltransferase involved in cell wall biosynthesis
VSTNKALVTVVIPCYNYAHYLGEAIESALAQTHQPLEVIVVDDGSTDRTQEVAQSYPVRLITQRNQGLSASTNNGVRAGRGEYFLRLDADDVLYPTFVEETLAVMEHNPNAALVHADGEFFGDTIGRVPFVPFDAEALAKGAMTTCCALFRRTAWDAVGGLDEDMVLCEDWDLWLTFAEKGMTGVMVRKMLWGYRQHGTSMANRKMLTWAGIRRELKLTCQLQDRHPSLFAPRKLLRRLAAASGRFIVGEMGARTTARLFPFYAIMLFRWATGLHAPRPRSVRTGAQAST